MTPAGWVVMLLSTGSVISLACFCLFRVMTLPPGAEPADDDDSES